MLASSRTPLRVLALTLSLLTVLGTGLTAASAAGAATVGQRPTVTRAVSGSVPKGKSITMQASVRLGGKPVRGVPVELFRITPAGLHRISTVVTNSHGSVSVVLTPTYSARYDWRFAGTPTRAPSGIRVIVKVTKPAVVPLGKRVLAEAAKHLGAPYVYGASGPNSFDCSGLTRYVFAKVGIALPRSSAQQYNAVRHVSVASRQVGDLIFFRLSGGGINHVGIYAGNDTILVAPKTGDHVRYERIWTSYSVGRAG